MLLGGETKNKIFVFYCVSSYPALWYLRMLTLSLCYSKRLLSRRHGSWSCPWQWRAA